MTQSKEPPPLRCEHCRYDLTGLKRSDNCPECGTPIEGFRATFRPGTPMQQSPTWRAWFNTARIALTDLPRWYREMSPQLDHFWRLDTRNHLAVLLGSLVTLVAIWMTVLIQEWNSVRSPYGTGMDREMIFFTGMYIVAMLVGVTLAAYLALRALTLLVGWILIARMNGWNAASRRRALNASVHGANVACGIFLLSQTIALIPTGLTALIESLFADPEYAAMVWFVIAGGGAVAAVFGMLIFTINSSVVLRRANLPGSEARLADD